MTDTDEVQFSGIEILNYQFLIHRVAYSNKGIEHAAELRMSIPPIPIDNNENKKVNKIKIIFYSEGVPSGKTTYANGFPGERYMTIERYEKDLNVWLLALSNPDVHLSISSMGNPDNTVLTLYSGRKG